MALILFDFDGVMVDSGEAIYQAIAAVAARQKVAMPSRAVIRTATMAELRQLLRVRWYQMPYYMRLARRTVRAHGGGLRVRAEILETLRWAQAHHEVGIVSSNSAKLIADVVRVDTPWLSLRALVGDAPMFGKHRALKGVLRRLGLQARQVIYVGDEVRDVEAARRVGMPCVAVGWGKDDADALQAAGPTVFAATGAQLLAALTAAAS